MMKYTISSFQIVSQPDFSKYITFMRYSLHFNCKPLWLRRKIRHGPKQSMTIISPLRKHEGRVEDTGGSTNVVALFVLYRRCFTHHFIMWRQISLRTERNKSIKFLVTIPFCLWNSWLHQKLNSSTSLNVNDLFLNPAGQDGTVYVCYLEARLYYGEKTIVFLI